MKTTHCEHCNRPYLAADTGGQSILCRICWRDCEAVFPEILGCLSRGAPVTLSDLFARPGVNRTFFKALVLEGRFSFQQLQGFDLDDLLGLEPVEKNHLLDDLKQAQRQFRIENRQESPRTGGLEGHSRKYGFGRG